MTNRLSSMIAPLKSNPHIKVPISYEVVFWRKICKRSYTSGDVKNNDALLTVKDGTSSVIDSAERSNRVSIGSSSTSVGCEEISSYSDTNSVTTSGSDFGPSTNSVSTRTGGFRSAPTFTAMLFRIFLMPARFSLHSAAKSLNCGLSSSGSCSALGSLQSASDAQRMCGAYRVRKKSCKTNQHRQNLLLSFHHQ